MHVRGNYSCSTWSDCFPSFISMFLLQNVVILLGKVPRIFCKIYIFKISWSVCWILFWCLRSQSLQTEYLTSPLFMGRCTWAYLKRIRIVFVILFQNYCILSSIVHAFLHWKWCWNIPAHYTWKVDEKEFRIAFMMNKLAIIISFEIILEFFFAKNHCEIQVRTLIVWALYSIKYGNYCSVENCGF